MTTPKEGTADAQKSFKSFSVEIPWFLPNSKDHVAPTEPWGNGSRGRILGLILWQCSGKVQILLFPSWGKWSIWEGASSPRWDFAFNAICPSLNGILLWFLPSSNKQKAHRFTLGLCSDVQTAWGPSQLFKKPPCQRGAVAPIYMYGSVCIYTHTHYTE